MCRQLRFAVIVAICAVCVPASGVVGATGWVRGDKEEFWKTSSVIIAEVVSMKGGNGKRDSDTIRLRPLGTLAGRFDSAQHPEVDVRTMLGGAEIGPPPHNGEVVAAVMTAVEGPEPRFLISTEVVFPFLEVSGRSGDGLQEVFGPTDDWVDGVLASIQKVHPRTKFTGRSPSDSAHIVIYALVKHMQPTKDGTYKIGLSPNLTLSGEFDIGGTPEIVVTTNAKKTAPAATLPRDCTRVIVAVVRNGNAFFVEPGRPGFMPGDHAPICVVNDVSDPKLAETRKALQALDKKKTDQNAHNAIKNR